MYELVDGRNLLLKLISGLPIKGRKMARCKILYLFVHELLVHKIVDF